nr:S8 family serine peptidase [Pseudomonas nitroreducens]
MAVTARADRLGHGTVVASTIRRACPGAVITHAQVFDDRPVTSALRVAAALRWFASMQEASRVDIVCMSLGLREDRRPLREAVELAARAGILLVASHPARGPSCYPAAYPDVLAGTGDARCSWDQLSHLGDRLFGAWSNSPELGGCGMAGASLGAARLAGHVAEIFDAEGRGSAINDVMARLKQRALFFGPERRRGSE